MPALYKGLSPVAKSFGRIRGWRVGTSLFGTLSVPTSPFLNLLLCGRLLRPLFKEDS